MSVRIPAATTTIVFDAVGTLIHPDPPAATAYFEVGRRFASRQSMAEIASRFSTAFRRQEDLDHAAGLRTDEGREVARWRAIVAEVLDDVTEFDGCFRELYEHFARASSWRIEAEVPVTLAGLRAAGYRLGIASNFDHRLRNVLAGGPLQALPLVVSSEVGWRKPAGGFFAAICRTFEAAPQEVLYVGDDLENDYDGARAAGFAAILFDPRKRAPATVDRIRHLINLVEAQRGRTYD